MQDAWMMTARRVSGICCATSQRPAVKAGFLAPDNNQVRDGKSEELTFAVDISLFWAFKERSSGRLHSPISRSLLCPMDSSVNDFEATPSNELSKLSSKLKSMIDFIASRPSTWVAFLLWTESDATFDGSEAIRLSEE